MEAKLVPTLAPSRTGQPSSRDEDSRALLSDQMVRTRVAHRRSERRSPRARSDRRSVHRCRRRLRPGSAGEIKRLLINVPPRYMKGEAATVGRRHHAQSVSWGPPLCLEPSVCSGMRAMRLSFLSSASTSVNRALSRVISLV